MVAYWKIEEGGGTTVSDSSGHGYDLVLMPHLLEPVNLPSWSDEVPPTTNADNKSLVFDGDNRAELANPSSHNSAFDFPAGFTIEAWIKPDSSKPGQDAGIVSKFKKEVGYGGYIMWLHDGKIENYIDGGLPGLTNVVDGNWHHVAITWDGSERAVYVDGIKETSAAWSTPPNSVDSIFYIATYDPADRNFKGNIDEVMVYNYARSQEKINEDAGITAHVVISEVQITGGAGATNHDFVEFYNPTSLPFDLIGHRLVKRTSGSTSDVTLKSWTSSTVVPPHGFYLWANSDADYALSIGADTSTSGILTDDDSIALRFGAEDTGVIIDALSWDASEASLKEGTEFFPDPGANQSMERKARSTSTVDSMTSGADVSKGNGYDTNSNAIDFVLRDVSQPQNSISPTEMP